ncbi:hypothetical protein JCM5353_003400, partial [Sporobolomyces roseus]
MPPRRRQSSCDSPSPPRRRSRRRSSSADPTPNHRRRPSRSASPPSTSRSTLAGTLQTSQDAAVPRSGRGLAASSRSNLTLGSGAAPLPPPPRIPPQLTHQPILTTAARSATPAHRSAPICSQSPPSPTSSDRSDSSTDSSDDTSDSEEEGNFEDWQIYGAALDRGEGLLIRLHPSIWIAEQWSPSQARFRKTYCHIYLIDNIPTCDCYFASPCTHIDYFNHNRPTLLAQRHLTSDAQLGQVYCFLLDQLRANHAAFSVQQTPGDYDSSKRVIVEFKDGQSWSCRTCSRGRGRCNHVAAARIEAIDIGLIDESGLLVDEDSQRNAEERERNRQERAALASATANSANAV